MTRAGVGQDRLETSPGAPVRPLPVSLLDLACTRPVPGHPHKHVPIHGWLSCSIDTFLLPAGKGNDAQCVQSRTQLRRIGNIWGGCIETFFAKAFAAVHHHYPCPLPLPAPELLVDLHPEPNSVGHLNRGVMPGSSRVTPSTRVRHAPPFQHTCPSKIVARKPPGSRLGGAG